MPDESFPIRRKIDVERGNDRRQYAADVLTRLRNVGFWHCCICSGSHTGCNSLARECCSHAPMGRSCCVELYVIDGAQRCGYGVAQAARLRLQRFAS